MITVTAILLLSCAFPGALFNDCSLQLPFSVLNDFTAHSVLSPAVNYALCVPCTEVRCVGWTLLWTVRCMLC